MEGLTSAGCMHSPYPYALKHNPFAYYGGSCPDNVVSLDTLDADLAHDTPRFVWITPGLCHDGHDCALAESRSEEHTSELQSQSNLVCRLLLEKKKKPHRPTYLFHVHGYRRLEYYSDISLLRRDLLLVNLFLLHHYHPDTPRHSPRYSPALLSS